MPRVSVVVPIYNVERYLADCLESLAAQTLQDLEVVMVDDGSTDRSAAIAQAFAERDPRFKLVSQANGGLSKARNTGIDAAAGEFLAFVDSDDVVAPDAYELLVGALDETGSDFATGNVHRLTQPGTRQARFLVAGVRRDPAEDAHHQAPRRCSPTGPPGTSCGAARSGTQHGLRFPEGRTYEDIPVDCPLHFAARSVDVLAEPSTSGAPARAATSRSPSAAPSRGARNRLAGDRGRPPDLAEHGPRKAKRWYDASVVADDLRYYLNALESADDEYRALFLDRVNAFLDGACRDGLPHAAGDRPAQVAPRARRMMPELLEILRFQREDRGHAAGADPRALVRRPPVPHRPAAEDPALAVPRRPRAEFPPGSTGALGGGPPAGRGLGRRRRRRRAPRARSGSR